MGADIHGVWEVRLSDGKWYGFNNINGDRNYEWFGILSGVRCDGPLVQGVFTNFDDVSAYWSQLSEEWNSDFHTCMTFSIDEITKANEILQRVREGRYNMHEDPVGDWETIPTLDDIIMNLFVSLTQRENGSSPTLLPMNIPLREIMGLSANASINDVDVRQRIRMMVAYDN